VWGVLGLSLRSLGSGIFRRILCLCIVCFGGWLVCLYSFYAWVSSAFMDSLKLYAASWFLSVCAVSRNDVYLVVYLCVHLRRRF
jgi:hypothetical protein